MKTTVIDRELLAKAIYTLSRCDFRFGKYLFVTGTDPFSVLCGLLARESGAASVVFCVDSAAEKQRMERMGFTAYDPELDETASIVRQVTNGRKFDVVIETTGQLAAYERLVQMVRRGAAVALLVGAERPFYFHICDVIRDQIRFVGIRNADERSCRIADDMIRTGKLGRMKQTVQNGV